MKRVFLSYRRADSTSWASLISDRLTSSFGAQQLKIYQDVCSNQIGQDFRRRLDRELAASDLVVSIIGSAWSGDNGQTRRIDDPSDLVRYELVTAEAIGTTVVPVLVDGISWCDLAPLPDELRWLPDRHSVAIRNDTYESDLAHLATQMGEAIDLEAATSSAEERDPQIPNVRTYIEQINAEHSTLNF